jgi:hypothetical protein
LEPWNRLFVCQWGSNYRYIAVNRVCKRAVLYQATLFVTGKETLMYNESLPFTGAGLAIGGHVVGIPMIISAAVGLILVGVGLYRIATRSRRAQTRD